MALVFSRVRPRKIRVTEGVWREFSFARHLPRTVPSQSEVRSEKRLIIVFRERSPQSNILSSRVYRGDERMSATGQVRRCDDLCIIHRKDTSRAKGSEAESINPSGLYINFFLARQRDLAQIRFQRLDVARADGRQDRILLRDIPDLHRVRSLSGKRF